MKFLVLASLFAWASGAETIYYAQAPGLCCNACNVDREPPPPTEIEIEIVPGERNVDSTVTITQEVPADNAKNLITYLLTVVVKANLIDRPTADRIIVTFIPSAPRDGVEPLAPTTTIIVGGDDKPRDKFLNAFITLLQSPKAPTSTTSLIKILFELLLDNGVVNVNTAVQIAVKFRVAISIRIVKLAQPAKPAKPSFPDDKLVPGQPSNSIVTITKVIYPEHVPLLVIRLLDILVDKKVLDVPTSNRILFTFHIPADPDFPDFNPTGASPLPPDDSIQVGGNPDPKGKFIKAIIQLIQNPPQGPPVDLVKILLELIIDNGIVDVKTASQIAVTYSLSIHIQITLERPEPTFDIDQINPGEPGESTVTITSVDEKTIPAAINTLLQILVVKSVVDVPTANSFLNTFYIPGRGQFKPEGASPLTSVTITTIQIHADEKPRQRFVSDLVVLINNPKPDKLIQILVTFLLDSGIVNLPTAQKILAVFRVGAQLRFKVILPVKEPQLVPGTDVGPNAYIDSTVTLTNIVRELPPLVKRLVELIVKASVIPGPLGNDILTTFNVQPGGSALTQTTVVQITLGGKPSAAKKFITNLTPLVANPSPDAVKTLIKILTELLVDNAVIHQSSAAQLLVAYGVGASITVRVVQLNQKTMLVPDDHDDGSHEVEPDQPDLVIVPGEPAVDSKVTITEPVPADSAKNLITYLLTIIVKSKLIDQPTVDRIRVTFITSTQIDGARPLEPSDTIVIGGDSVPKEKFLKVFISILQNPKPASSLTVLIKSLFELLIDNGVIAVNTATQIAVRFRIVISVRVVKLVQPQKPAKPSFPNDRLVPGQPSVSTVTITQVLFPEHVPLLINRLLAILVEKRILEISTVNRVLVTFRVTADPDFPFNPDGARPLSPDEEIPVRGSQNPRDKFLKAIIELINSPPKQGPAIVLVKILLELLIDNGIIDARTASQIGVTYSLSIHIQIAPELPEPEFSIEEVQQGEPGESTVFVRHADVKAIPTAVSTMLEILVVRSIIDVPAADSILATFRVPSRGRFKPEKASPLKSVTVIQIRAEEKPRQRFITDLSPLLANPQPDKLIQVLVTLLLDTGSINLATAQKLFSVFRIAGQIKFTKTVRPAIKEPQLIPGTDPGPTMVIDSTVTLTSVIRPDLAPLLKRLVALNGKAGLIPGDASDDILATFNIQGGGSVLTPATVAKISFGGKAAAAQKVVKNLAALVANPKASGSVQTLIKILTELLIDNAALHQNSAAQLLVSYGVGASISVRLTATQSRGSIKFVGGSHLGKR